jgi:hypothetical protein
MRSCVRSRFSIYGMPGANGTNKDKLIVTHVTALPRARACHQCPELVPTMSCNYSSGMN